MQTAKVAVPTLLAIAVVAAIVLALPVPTQEYVVAGETPQSQPTPYSADHGRIPAEEAPAPPAPTF